jgi:hypothetical protein
VRAGEERPATQASLRLNCAFHINGQSDSSLKRIIPEPHVPSRGSQARGTRLAMERIPLHFWEMEFSIQYHVTINSQLNDQNSIRYYIMCSSNVLYQDF